MVANAVSSDDSNVYLVNEDKVGSEISHLQPIPEHHKLRAALSLLADSEGTFPDPQVTGRVSGEAEEGSNALGDMTASLHVQSLLRFISWIEVRLAIKYTEPIGDSTRASRT